MTVGICFEITMLRVLGGVRDELCRLVEDDTVGEGVRAKGAMIDGSVVDEIG